MLTEWESHNQTRVHLEATGLLTAGELLIQIAQSCVPAGAPPVQDPRRPSRSAGNLSPRYQPADPARRGKQAFFDEFWIITEKGVDLRAAREVDALSAAEFCPSNGKDLSFFTANQLMLWITLWSEFITIYFTVHQKH